jgi:hypothetical protein
MTKSNHTNALPEKTDGLKTQEKAPISLTKAQKPRKRPGRPSEGRPSNYDQKHCEAIVQYFDVPHSEQKLIAKVTGKNDYEKEEYKEVGCPMRFLSGFARSINVSTQTLHNWCSVHPEFFEAFTRAKELQHEMLHSNSLKGLYDARYAVFAAKNMTDWRDKVEVDHGLTDDAYDKLRTMSVDELEAKIKELIPNRVAGLLK